MKMQSDARINVSFMSSIQEVLDSRVFIFTKTNLFYETLFLLSFLFGIPW